ncbi:MAG: GNAT family N-acetyltransferase, partial [bacterium]
LGAPYYPKLVGMSPATPSSAFAFLAEPGPRAQELQNVMFASIMEMAEETGMGGVAFNFADPQWMNGAGKNALEAHDFIGWKHQLYYWRNNDFTSFDDYLSVFTKNQRRNIRRERRSMEQQGIQIEVLTGTDITRQHLDWMYDYYAAHNARFGPWAAKFLNRTFFRMLADGFRHRIALVCAYSTPGWDLDTRPIAMAFLLIKNQTIWGRYWGAEEDVRDLHFNCCYYTPIEWAIDHQYRLFDPGMGSSHKIRRGFEAVSGYSLHHFMDERMQYILHNNIDRINSMESMQVEQLNAARPVHDNPYRGAAG